MSQAEFHVPIPALLRAARGSYATAIRSSLSEAGFDDLPRNSAFVLGGMVNQGADPADLIRELRVSKQASSQLIDTLVLRGYLARAANAEDSLQVTVLLTDRGRAAAQVVGAAVGDVNEELERRLSAEQLCVLRDGLFVLAEIREELEQRSRE